MITDITAADMTLAEFPTMGELIAEIDKIEEQQKLDVVYLSPFQIKLLKLEMFESGDMPEEILRDVEIEALRDRTHTITVIVWDGTGIMPCAHCKKRHG